MPQPAETNDHGAIVTVGMVANADRFAIVVPCFYDHSLGNLDRVHMCQDALKAMRDNILPDLLACLSTGTSVVFIQAEGMLDGAIPAREDYALADNPGTRAGDPAPSNVTALVTFYEEPEDDNNHTRIRSGKMFLSGLSISDLSGDHIVSGLSGAIATLGSRMLFGWASVDVPATNWYRGLAVPNRVPDQAIKRIAVAATRQYVATQRRRLIPHS